MQIYVSESEYERVRRGVCEIMEIFGENIVVLVSFPFISYQKINTSRGGVCFLIITEKKEE